MFTQETHSVLKSQQIRAIVIYHHHICIIFIQHALPPIMEGFMANGAFVHNYVRLNVDDIQKS